MFRTKPGEERDLIEDWINRPGLRKLVEAFGGSWPTGALEEVVTELVDFSEVWDYRAGKRDRHMFHEDQNEPDPTAHLTYEVAEELGMANPKPPSQNSYDYLLILGGLATGVEPRVRYAADLVNSGTTIRRQIAGLGSYRELRERELPIARKYARHGQFEIDHLAGMIGALLEGSDSGGERLLNRDKPTCWELRPASEDRPAVVAYSAVGGMPRQRPANTAETYELFLGLSATEPGQTALLVTSAIYASYQHMDALRVLGSNQLEIETVGVLASDKRTHPATAYRQEVRSTLRSAGLLLAAGPRPSTTQ